MNLLLGVEPWASCIINDNLNFCSTYIHLNLLQFYSQQFSGFEIAVFELLLVCDNKSLVTCQLKTLKG
jgi:hypothetical protein